MASPSDSRVVFAHQTRRAVANLCRAEPKTIARLKTELGARSDGAIRATVKKMCTEGILNSITGVRKGSTAYLLEPSMAALLDEALQERDDRPPTIVNGQRVVLVGGERLNEVARALGSLGVSPEVLWGARLHGQAGLDGLLVAFDHETPTGEVDSFLAALDEMGVRRAHAVAGTVMSREGLSAYADGLGSSISS